MANAAPEFSLNATLIAIMDASKRRSHAATGTGNEAFNVNARATTGKNITLRDYVLIVTSLSEDAATRRIVGTLSSRLRIQKILRPRPQHTVSLSVELVIFRILCCHRRFSLFLKCKYLYKFMTLNIM